MFANDAGINGFLVKQQQKSQKSAQNAKALIGIRQEKMKGSCDLKCQITVLT